MLKTNSKAVKTAIREFIATGAIEWAEETNEYDRENGYEPMAEAENLACYLVWREVSKLASGF